MHTARAMSLQTKLIFGFLAPVSLLVMALMAFSALRQIHDFEEGIVRSVEVCGRARDAEQLKLDARRRHLVAYLQGARVSLGVVTLAAFAAAVSLQVAIRRDVRALEASQRVVTAQSEELAARGRELSARLARESTLADSLRESNHKLEAHARELESARQRVELALARQRELVTDLARKNRDLDQFAYVASHDLKAPLRGIGNLAGWIEEEVGDALPDTSREHFRLLRGRLARMEALIEGILSYARAGRATDTPAETDLTAFFRGVVDMVPLPEGMTAHVPEGLPSVTVNRVPLQQVVQNLVANAAKHGARGGARNLWVDAAPAGDFFECSVRDDGEGIDPRYHARIFEIFQTLSSRDKVEGTGIGLAVVKKLVEGVGGAVRVVSAPGEGASFVFTWPRAQARDNTEGLAPSAGPARDRA